MKLCLVHMYENAAADVPAKTRQVCACLTMVLMVGLAHSKCLIIWYRSYRGFTRFFSCFVPWETTKCQ